MEYSKKMLTTALLFTTLATSGCDALFETDEQNNETKTTAPEPVVEPYIPDRTSGSAARVWVTVSGGTSDPKMISGPSPIPVNSEKGCFDATQVVASNFGLESSGLCQTEDGTTVSGVSCRSAQNQTTKTTKTDSAANCIILKLGL